jgi:predicted nucleic acid-binding protein
MYLVDTNVVSEFRKIHTGKADQNVSDWASDKRISTLFLSAMTCFELELGTLLLEKRDLRQGRLLRIWLDHQMSVVFAGRILPVDAMIARLSASLHVPHPRPERDAMIAATALVHRMTVVTRDVADFKPMGVPVLNPWDPQ